MGPADPDHPPAVPDVSDAPWSVEPTQGGDAYRSADYDEPEFLDEDGISTSEPSLREEEPRKRRRRRRGGRGRNREERGERSQPAERSDSLEPGLPDIDDPLESDIRNLAESREIAAEFSEAIDDADIDDDSELNRGHRAVPSWEEAVGIMVSANLESRAKSPESRGHQRGRGRGRGGRGRRDSR
jgi:hypothetical protein